MTRLCAQAMGIEFPPEWNDDPQSWHYWKRNTLYQPLHDDAQAMTLVKRFGLSVLHSEKLWLVSPLRRQAEMHADLNRAIVECVAKMHASRLTPHASPLP